MNQFLRLLLIVVCSAPALLSQPTLDFKRIEVRYPEITLAFKVTCGGAFRTNLGAQQFEVRENGFLVKDATIWCPPIDSCCISTTLVLDRTGSMQDTKTVKKISSVKAAANAFVDLMQTPCDEAGLVSFNHFVTVDVPMTSNKSALKSAINGMIALGNTALWDAAAEGIQQLVSSANNRCKAVILLTDGGENSSKNYAYRDVVNLALANKVKVFTIGYGLVQNSNEEAVLRDLAETTGGMYYLAPVQSDLNKIFTAMREGIKESYRECLISYRTGCPDGTVRNVELTLKDYCNGTVTKARSYTAPLDRSKFQTVQLSLGNASGSGTQEVLIPVQLQTPIDGIFSKSDFTVVYNRSYATLVGVSTAGTLLEGDSISFVDVGSGHTIFLRNHKEISGQGVLLNLRFRLADVIYNAETFVQISNWNFYAYCLIPAFGDGLLKIKPREPVLECDALVPEQLFWDDEKKDYSPNPFSVSVLLRNSGTREATNAKVRITLLSPSLSLDAPQTVEQPLSPRTLYPGREGRATWEIRSAKLESADSMRICFTVTSDNHPAITCCRTLRISAAQSSALECSLTSPDTIFFRDQYYEPAQFEIGVTARNTGSGQTKAVRGQLLQDTRFTVLTPASLLLAEILPPGQTAQGAFRVDIHPRQTDGFDTVRANVQGNDSDPRWCMKPIWVQRERRPVLTLSCTTPDDSLVFSEETSSYAPNPFIVTTIGKNEGETYAEECQILFAGPPRFTPIGTNLRPEGTMLVGETRSEQWQIHALPRTIAGWDTLVFQILGKGGLGRRIVVGECRLPVYVPAMRLPAYALSCSAPDSLLYDGDVYVPDPFPFTATLVNTGNAAGRNLTLTAAIPATVFLAPGETPQRHIAFIAAGDTIRTTWMLHPERRGVSGAVTLCTRFVDSANTSELCCRDTFIPREEPPRLELSCATIDSLFIDPLTGEYLGNPFNVYATVANIGSGTARTVSVSLTALGSEVEILDSSLKGLNDISPGDNPRVTWKVRAFSRKAAASVKFLVALQSVNHRELRCSPTVFIPSIRTPALSVECTSNPPDTLLFDWSAGDFSPKTITVSLRVRNTGTFPARNVRSLLIIPPGVVLDDHEVSEKGLLPSSLQPGDSGEVSWTVRALRQNEGAMRVFRFLVRSDNVDDLACEHALFVQGAPRKMTLRLPSDLLLRYGEKRTIPLAMEGEPGNNLAAYTLDISYDPTVVAFLRVTTAGALTERGWVGAVMQTISPGRARISDYTTSVPLHSGSGTLVSIDAQGVFSPGESHGSFRRSELQFEPGSVVLNGGDIRASMLDGSLYVTDDCLEPLAGASGASLEQNWPNPFSGETTIPFSNPDKNHIRLVVYDKMGRIVRVLVDGLLPKGTFSLPFTAAGVEPGVYFYRLESGTHMDVKKMIVR